MTFTSDGPVTIVSEQMERLLAESGIDLVVATSVENVFYPTGIYGVVTRGFGEAIDSFQSVETGKSR